MHGMYVCTPQLAGGNPLVGPNSFKTLGEGLRLVPPKGEFPLLIVPTPEGWKAEYTLASRMQIHDVTISCMPVMQRHLVMFFCVNACVLRKEVVLEKKF